MINPIFWLLLSFLLVSVSLTAVLIVLVPAVRELSRAARSVEKLCDTIDRELPPTLESIRLTSAEITHLTDDVNEGVQSASRVAQQVDHSVSNVRVQAQRVQIGTRSLMAGINAALVTLMQSDEKRDRLSHNRLQRSAKSSAVGPSTKQSSNYQPLSPKEPLVPAAQGSFEGATRRSETMAELTAEEGTETDLEPRSLPIVQDPGNPADAS